MSSIDISILCIVVDVCEKPSAKVNSYFVQLCFICYTRDLLWNKGNIFFFFTDV